MKTREGREEGCARRVFREVMNQKFCLHKLILHLG